MKKIYYYIYFFLVLLIFYKDSFIYGIFGEIGKNIGNVISLILLPILLIKGKFVYPKKALPFIKLILYLFIISSIMAVLTMFISGSSVIVGENLFVKMMKNVLTYASNVCFLLVVYNLSRELTTEKLFKPFFITFILIFIFGIFEYMYMPNAFPGLHETGGFPYYRLRLLTQESSHIVLLIFIYFVFSMMYVFTKKNQVLYSLICVSIYAFFLVFSASKGFYVLTMVGIIYLLFLYRNKISRRVKRLSLVMIVAIIYLIYPTLKNLVLNDFVNFTSIVTRLYTSCTGLICGILFPFGLGGSGYLYWYPNMLSTFLPITEYIGGNFSEVYAIINATSDTIIAVKSGLLNQHMIWGIVGTIIFLKGCYSIVKSYTGKYKKIVKYLMIMTIFSLLFFSNFEAEIWLVLAVILALTKNQESIENESKIIENKSESIEMMDN